MIKLNKETKKELIELLNSKNIALEGNIVKLLDTEGDVEFEKYLKTCSEKDKDNRKKRLEITKQVQQQNRDLTNLNGENQKIMVELQETLKSVEDSKITFEVQNRELNEWKQDNLRLTEELKNEMVKSEQARIEAENLRTKPILDYQSLLLVELKKVLGLKFFNHY